MRKLLFALAAPLLLLQGKRVRAVTPRLPEPPGDRQGRSVKQATEQVALTVLLLGDSAIAGVGSDAQADAVSGNLVKLLGDSYALEWQLVAKSSLTCAQVLALLQATNLNIAAPDAVLISVGVNDVTKRTPVKQWCRDLEQLTQYLRQQLGAKKIIYTALPPMHKFPALPQPLRWFVGQQALTLNRHLREHCEANDKVELLTFEVPYQPDFIASDGYHPSSRAAALWAEAAAGQICGSTLVD